MANEPTPLNFDLIDLAGDAWTVFRAHAVPYVVASLLILILINATGYFFIAGILLIGPLLMGLFKMALSGVRGEAVYLGDAFAGFDNFFPAVMLNLIVLFFSVLGIPFCLFPFLFILILLMPSYFFLLDGAEGVWDAIARTRNMVYPRIVGWCWVVIYVIVLNIIGLVPFGLGLPATVPISLISLALLYDRYLGHAPAGLGSTEA